MQEIGQPMTIKNIVTQGQCNICVACELPGDKERLSNTFGPGLNRVLEPDAPFLTISKQALEAFLLVRSVDHQDVANTRHH